MKQRKRIFLFSSFVAGTKYVSNAEELKNQRANGETVLFYHESDNQFDPSAVQIQTTEKERIGYLPREDNIVVCRLLKAGKQIIGEIEDVESKERWNKIKIGVYLEEEM